MATRAGMKAYQLFLHMKLREEIRIAAELDDNKSMHRFITDAIRDRVDRIMAANSIEVGNMLYRPVGVGSDVMVPTRMQPPKPERSYDPYRP